MAEWITFKKLVHESQNNIPCISEAFVHIGKDPQQAGFDIPTVIAPIHRTDRYRKSLFALIDIDRCCNERVMVT